MIRIITTNPTTYTIEPLVIPHSLSSKRFDHISRIQSTYNEEPTTATLDGAPIPPFEPIMQTGTLRVTHEGVTYVHIT